MTVEGQARSAYPAWRIFVFGLEVTDDVTSCRPNWGDDRAPSTAEFTLANKNDRYVITSTDIGTLYNLDLPLIELPNIRPMIDFEAALHGRVLDAMDLAESPLQPSSAQDVQDIRTESASLITEARGGYEAATQDTIDSVYRQQLERIKTIQDPAKRRVLEAKIKHRDRVSQPDFTQLGTARVAGPAQLAALRGEAYRYMFTDGDSIFHSNDHVRIFWRDPFVPKVWYHEFAGFVSDVTENKDVDGQSLITIRVEDVLRPFRYSRIVTNPGVFDIEVLQQIEDAVIQTFYNDTGFTDLTLPEVVYTICFGSDVAGIQLRSTDALPGIRAEQRRVSVNGVTDSRGRTEGVGAFNFDRSITFVFGPEAKVPPIRPTSDVIQQREIRLLGPKALAIYQAVVDHQVQPSDLENMVLAGQKPISRAGMVKTRDGAPKIEEVITAIGEHPELYPVDAGRLILLVPGSLGPNTNREILLKDLIQSIATQTTFRDRLSLMYDITSRIQFSFFATGRGDVLCEMPLFDFEPDDFGDEPVTRADIVKVIASSPRTGLPAVGVDGLHLDVGEVRGPYAPHFRIARKDTINLSRTFSDEKIRTQFATTWYPIQGLTSAGTAREAIGKTEVETLRALVPQFGMRLEFAEPTGYISSPEAAQVYCNLKLNQWNADARSSQVDMIPNLRLMPNRPVLFTVRNYIATIRSVDHNLVWNQDMSMSVGTNLQRGWNGLLTSDGRPIYTPIGGFASQSLNYAALFRSTLPDQSTAVP